MMFIGSFIGSGRLRVNSAVFDGVRYSIQVQTIGGEKTADGVLSGNGPAIAAAAQAGSAKLTFTTGETVDVVVTSSVADRAFVRLSGPVPNL